MHTTKKWRPPLAAGMLAAAASIILGCQTNAGPPLKAVGTVEDIMHDIVLPNAEIVWDSVGTIFTLEGTNEIRPGNEEQWMHVMQGALTVAEAGNLLMLEGRAKNSGEWMELAAGLVEAGTVAVNAVHDRNADDLFDAGGTIYEACTACHEQYWELPPSARRP